LEERLGKEGGEMAAGGSERLTWILVMPSLRVLPVLAPVVLALLAMFVGT